MFGLGMPEVLLILVVALIFIGPKKLPEIAKSLGKAMGEFKKATTDFKDSINLQDPPPTRYRDVKPVEPPVIESVKEPGETGNTTETAKNESEAAPGQSGGTKTDE